MSADFETATPAGAEADGVPGYEIVRLIAKGGMGEVYEARQIALDRTVALKMISQRLASEPAYRQRFMRESKLSANLDHPNILPVYEAGETSGGRLFLSMRLSSGEDLALRLARQGRLSVDDALGILNQIAAALELAHSRGLVHRDIKPANILLEAEDDGSTRAFLTDFGIAHVVESETLTNQGDVVGTVDYMAPEQASGGVVDRRSDVYAFGCLAYHCLTGQPPFRRDNLRETMAAHLAASPTPPTSLNPGIPEDVENAIMAMLAKDSEYRPSSAIEVMRSLDGHSAMSLEAQSDLAPPPPSPAAAPSETIIDLRDGTTLPLAGGEATSGGGTGESRSNMFTDIAIRSVVFGILLAAGYLIGRIFI